MTSTDSPSPAAPQDRILGFTKVLAVLLGSVVLYACVVLYLVPDRSVALFAWSIQPPMTAAFMGAAYANGVVFFAAVLRGSQWHRVWAPHVGVFTFATLLLLATILHWDRFNHSHPVFWAWVFIYSAAPLLTPWAIWTNRRQDPGSAEQGDACMPFAVRAAWAAAGVVFLGVALWAFVDPTTMISVWPWRLTPLTARVVVSFYALLGAAPLTVLMEPRWSAWRVGVVGMAVWHVLLLAAAFRCRADFTGGLVGWWLVCEVTLLVAIAATYVYMERGRTRRGSWA